MIAYEELAAALAGQRPVGRPIPQTTVIDKTNHAAADAARMEEAPLLAPPPGAEDATFNALDGLSDPSGLSGQSGQNGMTGEVDISDVVAEEEA